MSGTPDNRDGHFQLRDALSGAGLSIFLVALLLYFSFSAQHFATFGNATIILSGIAVIGIISIGQTVAIISGGFDLSTSGVVPLGSIVFAKSLNSGIGLGPSLLLTLALGATVGAINGFAITKIGINPLITTLGMLSITAGTAAAVSDGAPVPFKDVTFNVLGASSVGQINNDVWILIVLVLLAVLLMRGTTFGRSIYAIGGNRDAAWLAGLKVGRITATVYVLSGCLSALAGAVLASQLLTGSITVGTDSALTSIAAVVLGGGSLKGGVGGIGGTVVGVLILGVFQNGLALMHVAGFYQEIATGAILLVAVAFGQLRDLLTKKLSNRRFTVKSHRDHGTIDRDPGQLDAPS